MTIGSIIRDNWEKLKSDFKENRNRMLLDYLQITVGAILIAFGYNLFFVGNSVVSGGITGLGVIVNFLTGWPIGVITLALNVPLFFAGLRWGGGVTTGLRTLYGVLALSLAIDLTAPFIPTVTENPLLFIMYGGVLDGIGMGLVLRSGGTTGGTDIIGRIMKTLAGLNIARTIFISNLIIISLAIIVFSLEKALYGVLVAAVSAYTTEFVLGGSNRVRKAVIISNSWPEIRDGIFETLGRGVTIVQGKGGYTESERPFLLCVVSRNELITLRRLVEAIDPDAFVIVTATTEVWGEGFTAINDEIT